MKKQKVDKSVLITGLCCITALDIFAMYKGIDGIILTSVIGIIAFAIGLKLPTPKVMQ